MAGFEPPIALASLIGITGVYRAYDAAASLLEASLGTPLCVRCGQCCRENTPIAYGLEAANAVSHLIGQGRLYPMQRRIEGWLLDRSGACTIRDSPRITTMALGLDPKLQAEVLALSKTQCPFYEETGCMVHDCRPLACRAYGVSRSNYTCTRPLGKGETREAHMVLSVPLANELRTAVKTVLDTVPRPTWKHAGLFPTLIFAHAWPETFARMVANHQIQTAKLVMTYPSMAVLFEDDAQRISLSREDIFRKRDQHELVTASYA